MGAFGSVPCKWRDLLQTCDPQGHPQPKTENTFPLSSQRQLSALPEGAPFALLYMARKRLLVLALSPAAPTWVLPIGRYMFYCSLMVCHLGVSCWVLTPTAML